MINGKCPNCGGEVKDGKCQYCDTVFSDSVYDKEKIFNLFKNVKLREAQVKKRKDYAVIAAIWAAVIIAAVCFLIFIAFPVFSKFMEAGIRSGVNSAYYTRPSFGSNAVYSSETGTQAVPDFEKIEVYKENGRWPSGTYKIGEDIPEGTYLMITDGSGRELFPAGIYSDSEASDGSNLSSDTWASFSRYVTLKEPGYLDFSGANVYELKKNDPVNDPHEHSGMFLVGRDIEPGTYVLTFDKHYSDFDSRADYAKYSIYSDVDMVAPVVKEQGDFEEGMEITLQEGDYLKLEECVIR
ncbi:MAG: hypothetical protein ACI4JB_03260 [Porcipelethomonas sp.]